MALKEMTRGTFTDRILHSEMKAEDGVREGSGELGRLLAQRILDLERQFPRPSDCPQGDDALSRPERELSARAVGRVLYISLDRYDIQYVTRLLTRVLVCPCKLDLHRLRHLAKFLLGTKD